MLTFGLLGLGGCVEWFEVDEPGTQEVVEADNFVPQSLSGTMATLPGAAPRVGASGTIVPKTPGLRVPEGYWTRVRLDQADLLLPFTWAAIEPAGYSPDGDTRGTLLRLQSHVGAEPSKEKPSLRAVIRIATPPNTPVASLAQLSFGPDALRGSTVSVRLSKGTLWTVELERLSLSEVDTGVLSGTLEGNARVGKRAKRRRSFRAAFVALRGPESGAPSPTNP